MAEGHIPYAQLVETALYSVVRNVLDDVAANGLIEPHHYYISFRTSHPGVVMPDELRQRYEPEMTIVLQRQFWDLDVCDDGFGVSLSFGGRRHRLFVPFTAIKVFADPSVDFGLQFTLHDTAQAEAPVESEKPAEKPVALPRPADAAPMEPEEADAAEDAKSPIDGAEVVSLDQFRRK
ncbi:MAG: SspB family protein [Geminicoccaceae bacterium]